MYEQEGWKIDFDEMTRRQFNELVRALNKDTTGDTALPYYGMVIVAWPYAPLDPKRVEDYDTLKVPQWVEVNKRVSEAIKSL